MPKREKPTSWWANHCGASEREQFIAAAKQRDLKGQSDPIWQRPENFKQLSQT